jgi:hypothetical protein
LRGIEADVMNKKGKEHHDEIERKGHPKLGKRNE